MFVFISVTIGFAALIDYLIALHAAASAEAVPVRVRPGRRGSS